MEKLFIILLLIPSILSAQVHTGLGLGTDFKHIVASLNVGFEVNKAVIEGEMSPSLSREACAHNYFAFKAGYNFGGIIPSVGYYYDKVSADKTNLNGSYVGYSIKAYTMINDRGGLFVNGLYVHKSFQLTAGIHYLFQ